MQAAHPLSSDVLLALGFDEDDKRITTAAVCLYPSHIKDAVNSLKKMGVADRIPVASGTLCMCVCVCRRFPSRSTALVSKQIVYH